MTSLILFKQVFIEIIFMVALPTNPTICVWQKVKSVSQIICAKFEIIFFSCTIIDQFLLLQNHSALNLILRQKGIITIIDLKRKRSNTFIVPVFSISLGNDVLLIRTIRFLRFLHSINICESYQRSKVFFNQWNLKEVNEEQIKDKWIVFLKIISRYTPSASVRSRA